MKRKLLVGVTFSALFLYLALRGIKWDEFADAFARTNYWYLAPSVFFTMLGHFSRSIRWKYMIAPVKRISISSLWSATAIAFMANNLFPARVGEFVRAYAIGRTENVSKSASFATIVFERVIDVFVLIILLLYCLLTIEGPAWLTRSAIILMLFNVGLLALLYIMVRSRDWFLRTVRRATGRLPQRFRERLFYSLEAFVDGLGVMTDLRAAIPIALYSLVVWGSAVLGVYYAAVALGIGVPILASVTLIVIYLWGR